MNEHPVRRYRRHHNLTLQALGDRVGVSRTTIFKIENGSLEPRLALIQRFEETTDLRAEDFLHFLRAGRESYGKDTQPE